LPQCLERPDSYVHEDWVASELCERAELYDESSDASCACHSRLTGRYAAHEIHSTVRHSGRRTECCNSTTSTHVYGRSRNR